MSHNAPWRPYTEDPHNSSCDHPIGRYLQRIDHVSAKDNAMMTMKDQTDYMYWNNDIAEENARKGHY